METSRGRFCSQPISSRAFHWLLIDYLILAPTHWPPQRAVNVPSQRPASQSQDLAGLQTIVAAFAAANFVQNKVHPWQPRLSSRAPTMRTCSYLRIPRSTWAQTRPDALTLEQKQEQFVHLAIALGLSSAGGVGGGHLH